MFSQKRTLLILIGLFLLSVIVRLPTLNRPLSKHHEFCTAVALRVIQIWDEAGIATCHFNPVMTYPNTADKFINNFASGSGKMVDEGGNYYYVSHPPLAYYLPFAIFKIFRIKPDVLPIELLNLFIHFLCGIGVYLILQLLIPNDSMSSPTRHTSTPLSVTWAPALGGFVAYLFSPGTLWFHSNVYMADILVQLFFIYGVFFALKFETEQRKKWLILLGVSSFLMTYTSWLGVFFCMTVIVLSFWRRDFKQAIVIAACTAAALLLTIFQYSQIAGWDALKQEWFFRFAERSGWSSWNILTGLILIVKNYLTSYLPLIALLSVLMAFFFRQTTQWSNKNLFSLFILLSTVPIVLLHSILSNYSGHDFTTLYGGLFFCVIFGMLVHAASQKRKTKWVAAGMIVFVSLSIAQYYYINRPGEYSVKGNRYADFKDIGKSIAGLSSSDEVIFLKGMKPSPEIIFYAGRNIQQIHDENEAIEFLQKHFLAKGVILKVVENNEVHVKNRITVGF